MSDAGSLVGVVNAGSSSLKFALYDGEAATLSGQVEGIGVRPLMKARGASGETLAPLDLGSDELASPAEALVRLLPWLRSQLNGQKLAAIGHRVVHGGPQHAGPARVTG